MVLLLQQRLGLEGRRSLGKEQGRHKPRPRPKPRHRHKHRSRPRHKPRPKHRPRHRHRSSLGRRGGKSRQQALVC